MAGRLFPPTCIPTCSPCAPPKWTIGVPAHGAGPERRGSHRQWRRCRRRAGRTSALRRALYVSGEIPRVTSLERGFPGQFRQSATGAWEVDEIMPDERFVAVNVAGKGQIIFTACSHAGLINVLSHARRGSLRSRSTACSAASISRGRPRRSSLRPSILWRSSIWRSLRPGIAPAGAP